MENKSLAKNSMFNMIYMMLNIVFPLATTMYVSHILMPEGVGKVAYAQNITGYFIMLASLGLPRYGVREIAKRRDAPKKRNQLFTELLIINTVTTGISVIAFLAFVFSGSDSLDRKLMLCCGLQLFFNFFNIDWLYDGLEEYRYFAYRSAVVKALSLFFLVLFVRDVQDYFIYALINSIAFAGNYIFNVIHARHYVKLDFSGLHFVKHFYPLFLLGVTLFFSSIYSYLDITMLGTLGNEFETGLYSNGVKIVNLVSCLSASISSVFLPRLSYYYETDRDKFHELIQKGVKVLSFFSFPISFGLFFLAPYMVDFMYGPEFTGCATIVQVLAVLVLVKSFGDLLCYQTSIATGNEKQRLWASVLATVVNATLNLMLIPVLGGIGAAIASAFSESVLNLFLYYKMKRMIYYRVDKKVMAFGLINSLVMSVAVLAVLLLDMNSLLTLIVATAVGGIVYGILNFIEKNEVLFLILKKFKLVK